MPSVPTLVMGGRSGVQGYPQLRTELEAIPSYVRSTLKRECKIYVKENENEREEERTRKVVLSTRFSLCSWLLKGRQQGYRVLGTRSGEERDEGRCLRWCFSRTLYNSASSPVFPHHPSLFSSQLGTACPCLLSCFFFLISRWVGSVRMWI